VIISVGGRPVDYVAQLQEAIAFRKPGETVEVEVARKGGQRAKIQVPLQRVPEPRTAAAAPRTTSRPAEETRTSSVASIGITVSPLDAGAVRDLEIPTDVQGVLVTDVDDASPAAGRLFTLRGGGPDVILSVEGQAVTSPDALRTALSAAKAGDIVSLRVYNVPQKSRRVERIRVGSASGR
jgi:serine protease Do